MYDIYKNRCNRKINSLNTKNRKKLDYKKLRLSDDYQYSSEEEQKEKHEEEQKEKQDEEQEEKIIADANVFNEQINKEEKNINNELFKKHFKFQTPSAMLKFLNDLKQYREKQ